jgi:hypothetical protein
MDGGFHRKPVPAAFLLVSGNPEFHFIITGGAGCDKHVSIDGKFFSCLKGIAAFSAPAST